MLSLKISAEDEEEEDEDVEEEEESEYEDDEDDDDEEDEEEDQTKGTKHPLPRYLPFGFAIQWLCFYTIWHRVSVFGHTDGR